MAATQEHRPRETLSVVRCGMGGVFPNLCEPMFGRRGKIIFSVRSINAR